MRCVVTYLTERGVCMQQGATYVLNVVVSKRHRRRGVGQALMAAARRLAKEQWGSTHMCTHVSAQNKVTSLSHRNVIQLRQSIYCNWFESHAYVTLQVSTSSAVHLLVAGSHCTVSKALNLFCKCLVCSQAALALYGMCGFQQTDEESVLNSSASYGGSLLGKPT